MAGKDEISGNHERGDSFDYRAFMAKYAGVTVSKYADRHVVYAQGDIADAIFYIVGGSVKIIVLSEQGKEGIVAMLGPGDFFGEGSLGGRPHRTSTITTTSASEIVRFSAHAVRRGLAGDSAFSIVFFKFVLERNAKLKADLIDQLFNSSEKRLARILLTLASAEPNDQQGLITMAITQETLANMVGTTRARINQFMRKFSKLGYIEYNGTIRVRASLLNIILEETHNGR